MFLFSLADKHGKTVNELGKTMGADEMMEWVAFYKLKDDKYAANINEKIQLENSPDVVANNLKMFFSTLTPRKPKQKKNK